VRRFAYWTAVLISVVALAVGGVYAYVGYRATSGPDGAVKGYFAALARGDAPAALGFGDRPTGPHDLLTSAVLAEQQRIAPLHDLRITDVARAGSEATVRFSYQLGFARGNREVTGSVRVLHRGSGWRLAETAVATTIDLTQATDRLSFAGSSVPEGPTLMFPGALPIRFDTAYLMLDPLTTDVEFGTGDRLRVTVVATPAARDQLMTELGAKLRACVSGPPPAADCPLPSARYVPGSLHGRIVGDLSDDIHLDVSVDAAGTISATGTVHFTGRYRRLTYENVATARRGALSLPVAASAYAVRPLAVRFASDT
jgi:hypothetical protein